MEKKYISSSRYKKTIKSKKNKRRVQSVSYKLAHTDSMSVYTENEEYKNRNAKTVYGNKFNLLKLSLKFKIFISIVVVILGLALLRAVLKEKDEGFWDFLLSNKTEFKSEYTVTIHASDISAKTNYNNLAVVELDNMVSSMLLHINEDYSITYDVLEKVEKLSNESYRLYIKEDYLDEITSDSVKTIFEGYKNVKSLYYKNVSNIKNIQIIDNKTLDITLNESDPLYIYKLNIPLSYTNKKEVTENSIQYVHDKTKFNIAFENDINVLADNFKNLSIDMFITGDRLAVSKMGNYSYDIYSYRTGETVFLFGNKNSIFFKDKVLRQAIAYSINKTKIIQDVYLGSGDTIDIPYIYSNKLFPYDIYSAQNSLLDNGYILNNGKLCKKYENGNSIEVVLKLLVNKEDTKKVQIAKNIQEDLKQQRNNGYGYRDFRTGNNN